MRKANTNDLFNFARLINDLDLKDEFFKTQQGKEDLEEIGFGLVFDVIVKATTKNAQQKIYEFLAEPFEMEVEEIGKLEIDVLIKNFIECFNLATVINFTKQALS